MLAAMLPCDDEASAVPPIPTMVSPNLDTIHNHPIMKKLSITVKSLLVAALVAATASYSDKQSTVATTVASGDSTVVLPNIRYIDADSVMSAYSLARMIAEEGQRELLRLQQQQEQKQKELQSLGNSIQQKQQNNGYLSQASFDADVQNFQKKQAEAERFLGAQQQRVQAAMAAAQQRLNDSISNYVRDYNATHGYDAILLREAGVFFNPALDITAEIIEGLNSRLKTEDESK